MSALDSTTTPTPTDSLAMTTDSTEVLNTSIYLMASTLIANEANQKARPGELPDDRAKRIAKLAQSIKDLKQLAPVLVIEVDDESSVHYEYIDGGGRVDAIAALNAQGDNRPVWCTILPGDTDLFRTAVRNNIDRFQNSVLELVSIVRESQERNNWKGRGANKKTAEYLGMAESRIAELLKIGNLATPKLKAMMASGEVNTIEAALRLVGLPEDKIDVVAVGAVEIAKERAVNKEATKAAASDSGIVIVSETDVTETTSDLIEAPVSSASTSTASPAASTSPAKPVVVGTADIRQAAQNEGETVGPLSKKELLEFFAEKCGPAYSAEVQAFCLYFVETYAKGQGTDRTANKLFDSMSFQTKESKAENKLKAKEAADAVKAEEKAAADKEKAKADAKKAKEKGKK